MLHLAYLGESKKMNIPDTALKLFIVRKPIGGVPKGFTHVPQLSPSEELFNNTQVWKENKFTNKEKDFLKERGIALDNKEAWWALYKERFEKELIERPDMIKALKRLEEVLKEGKEVYLFCFCKDLDKCHRSLIGIYMQGKGYEVNFRRK